MQEEAAHPLVPLPESPQPPESPEHAAGPPVLVPRKPSRDFYRIVVVHNVPLPTAEDPHWSEAHFNELLSAQGVTPRLHDDPHQPGHRRLLADCATRRAASRLRHRLSNSFNSQLAAHFCYTFLDSMRRAEKETIRRRFDFDDHARRTQLVGHAPVYKPESFYTVVEVAVRPDTFDDADGLRRTFESFGTVLRMEAQEPLEGARRWLLTYPFTAQACAAEFTYHAKLEGDFNYSAVIRNHHPYSRLLFLMAIPLTDEGLRPESPGDPPGALSPVPSTSDGAGCIVTSTLYVMCGWSCCAPPQPTPGEEMPLRHFS